MNRQNGIGLVTVAVVMAVLAALAMAVLFSLRHERNLLAEGWQKITGRAAAVAPAVALPAPPSPIRKCTVEGKTVISNTECGNRGIVLSNRDSRGIEPPKAPPAPAQQSGLRDKMLERALP